MIKAYEFLVKVKGDPDEVQEKIDFPFKDWTYWGNEEITFCTTFRGEEWDWAANDLYNALIDRKVDVRGITKIRIISYKEYEYVY